MYSYTYVMTTSSSSRVLYNTYYRYILPRNLNDDCDTWLIVGQMSRHTLDILKNYTIGKSARSLVVLMRWHFSSSQRWLLATGSCTVYHLCRYKRGCWNFSFPRRELPTWDESQYDVYALVGNVECNRWTISNIKITWRRKCWIRGMYWRFVMKMFA